MEAVATSEIMVLFPAVDMLGSMPESSSSWWDFLSVQNTIDKRKVNVGSEYILSKGA